MKVLVLTMLAAAVGCSSPTAPTTPPVATVPPVVTPPVVTPPVIVVPEPTPTPPPNPLTALLADPRFDRAFYRQFALNGHESPHSLRPLQRKLGPPNIYLMTVDDAGAAIDAITLDITAAALINTTSVLTGAFGVGSLQRGTGHSGAALDNMITVLWSSTPDPNACGRATVGRGIITLYPKTPRCRCGGNPATINPSTVKHELGHALGFWHTDSRNDLMYFQSDGSCDQNPSDREIFHARVAYAMPIGSLDP